MEMDGQENGRSKSHSERALSSNAFLPFNSNRIERCFYLFSFFSFLFFFFFFALSVSFFKREIRNNRTFDCSLFFCALLFSFFFQLSKCLRSTCWKTYLLEIFIYPIYILCLLCIRIFECVSEN